MRFLEREISFPKIQGNRDLLSYIEEQTSSCLSEEGLLPIRIAVTDSSGSDYKCEVGALCTEDTSSFEEAKLVFEFKKRKFENTKNFNVVFLIPTGIGCEIGGHAGDATPVARLLSSSCDNLITHPNVFNASDLNEMPENSLYVEGSTICRLMMGTVGLQPVRSNRILAVIDKNEDRIFENAAVNSINAARAVLGIECSDIVKLDPSIAMKSDYSSSKRAVGVIDGIDHLFSILKRHEGSYDAVAISSIISVPESYHKEYFESKGDMVNPWGGVEAMLTHAVSYKLNIPSAHSPMFESTEIAHVDPGVVEARMSAEAVSTTFFHCVLKGLHKSPKIITDQDVFHYDDIISAKDISCLVIPDGCLGLPTLAALEQGIKVVAVKENKNLMKNDLNELPWDTGQFIQVENYLEAAGVLNSIKNGIDPSSIRRPFKTLDLSGTSDISRDSEYQRPALKQIKG
ncbi:MAG: DUF3326 domain-containing protein [Candidatus Dadabacteria bacterium]|nr:DUF3326 domain-containing protein [Candidatus Dadabacteria bacterium]